MDENIVVTDQQLARSLIESIRTQYHSLYKWTDHFYGNPSLTQMLDDIEIPLAALASLIGYDEWAKAIDDEAEDEAYDDNTHLDSEWYYL